MAAIPSHHLLAFLMREL